MHDNMLKFFSLDFILLFFLFFLFASPGLGQTEEQIKDIKKGDQSFTEGNYGDALKYFLPLLETLDETSIITHNLNYKIGFCYYATAPEDSFAVPFFRKYLESTDVHFEAYYFLGHIAASNHDFDSAIFHFKKFKELVENNSDLSNAGLSEQIIEIADKQIEKSVFGKFLIEFPGCAKVESPEGGVNSEYSEYAPVITPDEKKIAFTRRSPETLGGRISSDGDFFEDVFISDISLATIPLETDSFGNQIGDATMEAEVYTLPINMGQRINTEGHEGAIQFSSDGKKFYIYRKSNIWISEKKKKETPYVTKNWKKAKKQKQIKGVLQPKTFEPSVSLSADGNILFFSSEREGGFGGLDLYKSVKGEDGKWSRPMNLGQTINTPLDEDAPFFAPDGRTLYFSSKGHSNMGDYDIFVSEFSGEIMNFQDSTQPGWSEPMNMGFPINSANDDIFFSVTTLSGTGYFSSNRNGTRGLMDIYKAKFPSVTTSRAVLNGTMKAHDSIPAFVNISLIEKSSPGDSLVIFTDSATGTFSLPVKFGKTYFVNAWDKNYEPKGDTIEIPNHVYFCQQYSGNVNFILQRIIKDTIPPADSLRLQNADSLAKQQADSAALADSIAKADLAETLKKVIKSVKKNDPVKKEEATAGIIFRVQLGAFKNPLSKNIFEKFPDLKSISFEDGFTRYFSGSYSTPEEARARKNEIAAEGFPDAFIVAFKDGKKIPLKDAIKKR